MHKNSYQRLNKLIEAMPSLALAELQLQKYGQNTLFAEIEATVRRARLPVAVARQIEEQVVRGDFQAMRLPAYQPKNRFPLTPADWQRERGRKTCHEQANHAMNKSREWCLRRKEDGWSMAEILLQEKAD